jgi:outer membrane biosynthesis protein TonB
LSLKSSKERKVRAGVAISSIGHAVILGWGLIAFAPAAFDTPPAESMPVDLVPITDITQLQAGNKDAPKKEQPKQTGEKKEEPKRAPEAEQKPKQPEVKQAAAPPPEAKPEPKPEPKKEEPKPEPKKEAATPLPPKRETPPKPATPPAAKSKQRDFNPDQIAALLDKRQPNMARASEAPAPTGAFGASTGNAPRLTQNEIDALRAQIQACWNPPVGAADAPDLVVRVRVQFRTDGSLSAEPQLVNRGSSPYFQVAAESAMRAVRRCQPYTLPAAKYEIWRDVEVTFDPRDMFGG